MKKIMEGADVGKGAVLSLPFIYDAFISYRQVSPDEGLAFRLHSELETYRVPRKMVRGGLPRKLRPVFIDRHELQSGDLKDRIATALKNSRFLIVVCSPRTPSSQWVSKEIELFLQTHDRNRVLPVLLEGELQESLPPALRLVSSEGSSSSIEYYAVDLSAPTLRGVHRLLNKEKLRLLATVLGCRYDDLKRRDIERRRRSLFTVAAVAVTFALALASLFLWSRTNRYQISRTRLEIAQSVAQSGDDVEPYVWWSEALLAEKDFNDAVQVLSRIRDSGARSSALMNLALTANSRGLADLRDRLCRNAIESAHEPISNAPLVGTPLPTIAISLKQLGKNAEARQLLEQALMAADNGTDKSNSLSGLITTSITSGDIDLALRYAPHLETKNEMSRRVASMLCEVGHCNFALRWTQGMSPTDKERYLGVVAKQIAAEGDLNRALKIIRTFTSVYRERDAIEDISKVLALRNDAKGLLNALGSLPQAQRDQAALSIARVVHDNDKSPRLLSDLAAVIHDSGTRDRVLVIAADMFSSTGDADTAQALARQTQSPDLRAEALTSAARAYIRQGRSETAVSMLNEAEAAARSHDNSFQRLRSLVLISFQLVKAGRGEYGRNLLEATINSSNATPRNRAVLTFLAAQLAAEMHDRPRAKALLHNFIVIADSIRKELDMLAVDDMLVGVAKYLITVEFYDEALKVLWMVQDLGKQMEGISELAETLLKAGKREEALNVESVAIALSNKFPESNSRQLGHCLIAQFYVKAYLYRNARSESQLCSPGIRPLILSMILQQANGITPTHSVPSTLGFSNSVLPVRPLDTK
jgi:tetratricopeptide (TPR) repeat protein